MCLLCRKRKSKKRQWFLVDEDIEEMQVPQQDLQVVVHEPTQVVEQDMEEVHVVQQVVEQDMEEVHVVQQVVDEATEEVQGEEQVVDEATEEVEGEEVHIMDASWLRVARSSPAWQG
jgi:hypothetical protein